MDLEGLGRRLRGRRAEMGLGLLETTQRTGLSHSYLSRLERGLVPRPTVPELEGVARGYGFRSVVELLEGEGQSVDDATRQVLGRHPELAERFAAISAGWESLGQPVRDFVLATLDGIAGQVRAAQGARPADRP
ncbi:MAG: helix-turn-helix domain-containing protein [Chloroflexota bacterium]|nr:helix-turn-helix domain-containing protein [Chloroflexota bacterium]